MTSELKEQARFVQWARSQGLKISAIAQSTYTESWKAINDNVMAGVVRGVPDLIIIIPSECRLDGKNKLVFIEMKKEKGGVVSKEQKEWIASLNLCSGVIAMVCRGCDNAIYMISPLIEKPWMTQDKMDNFINSLK
jgi:hypothetical protein